MGVPLFQEQLMQMAIDAAGFTPGEADQLRQAMGSKRSKARMAACAIGFMEGWPSGGSPARPPRASRRSWSVRELRLPREPLRELAYLVYSSAWIKLHYPAEFVCGLLNAQPMGFYSPHTLVRDARRHGVEILVVHRTVAAGLHARSTQRGGRPGRSPVVGWHADPSIHAVRTGCVTCAACRARCSIASTSNGKRHRSVTSRTSPAGPAAPVDALESLATAGAFACFGVDRRAGLWPQVRCATRRPTTLPGVVTGIEAPTLPGMSEMEETEGRSLGDGHGAGRHPTEFVRAELTARGVVTASALREIEARRVVEVAGWSRTVSNPRPRTGPSSSTWRTRPA